MNNTAWHQQCTLRDDVRHGTLGLAEFAADLYAVRTGNAPNVYRIPAYFFDRTYPTRNLKTLAREVLRRLAGQGGDPVITVQVAYGGGKTHALIALLHLAELGSELHTHPTVQEFIGFSGLDTVPQAKVAILPFDKFDAKDGLFVVSPDGKKQQVKTPWGALAYQLAGDAGLARIAAHEADYINPSEQLLVDLLKMPQAEGVSTLILLDEALMYTRAAVNDDPKRFGILQDFFQALTQAVKKVSTASLVASLITSDIIADDPTGVRVLNMLEGVFKRLEQVVEPVVRDDVSELLRRRLFEYVPPQEKRHAIVDKLFAARQTLPVRPSDTTQEAYDKLLNSYPFNPNLIEVFYQKWTQLGKFQGTRGMFRIFALMLKEAAGKDPDAFVGPRALLANGDDLSEATQELINACDEGNQWTPILTGELAKARTLQKEVSVITSREIERAVLSTFLHSQPVGQKAEPADLYLLLEHANIDQMSVEAGLSKWRETSWFLKEDKNIWALGTTANLTNLHVNAMHRLTEDQVTEDIMKRIREIGMGRNTDKIAVHTLPQSLADISDTVDLRFVIVSPEWTADAGEPVSPELQAFFERTHRNSIVLLAPETTLLMGLRERIRKILGWQNIEGGDEINLLTDYQRRMLSQRKRADEDGISESVTLAYSALIALDAAGNIKVTKLAPGTGASFERIKNAFIDEDRLLTAALDPDLLMPSGPFEIWEENETEKSVQGLYGMFGSVSRLPRLLNRQVFIDTILRGIREGQIVLGTVRPDGSYYTYWRELPAAIEDLWQKSSEVVPIEYAKLHNLNSELLRPGRLPEIWPDNNMPTTVGIIREFFSSDETPQFVSDTILPEAIQDAVQTGLLMARHEGNAYFRESIPDAELTDALELLAPLAPISGSELSPTNLPDAWENGTSSVGKLMDVIATRKGTPVPWSLIRDAVTDAVSKNFFEFVSKDIKWPCDAGEAERIGLKVSQTPVTIDPNDLIGTDVESAWESGHPTLALIKETLETKRGISIADDIFHYVVERAIDRGIIISDAELSPNSFYQIRVRKPAWIRHAESHLTESEIQDLAELVIALIEIAPELAFKFRISITAEGDPPSSEVLEKINNTLQKVTDTLKLG